MRQVAGLRLDCISGAGGGVRCSLERGARPCEEVATHGLELGPSVLWQRAATCDHDPRERHQAGIQFLKPIFQGVEDRGFLQRLYLGRDAADVSDAGLDEINLQRRSGHVLCRSCGSGERHGALQVEVIAIQLRHFLSEQFGPPGEPCSSSMRASVV